MGTIITDLYNKFRKKDIVVQLISLNVAVFLIIKIAEVLIRLFGGNMDLSFSFLALPASFAHFVSRPWSVITYMFVHANIWHILFNMLCLYWFGKIFLIFFSTKHLRGIYILGGIIGGLLFMLFYNIFPFFKPMVNNSFVVGASASILAIIFAVAYREPNYKILLLFIGNIRLKYLALAAVVVDLLFITSSNAGGHIAHLGGALTGIFFSAALNKGVDFTSWINKIIDVAGELFSRSTWHRRKPKMKIHYSTGRQENDEEYNLRKKRQNDEIDKILDKLKKSGYGNLTNEEKKKLFDASKK